MTYTYAILEVSSAAYAEIKAALLKHGYELSVHDRSTRGEVIDMHGLALKERVEPVREVQ